MANAGETPERAAERLGLTLPTLHKWCDRHAKDLWTHLMTNQDAPGHGARRGRTTIGAAQ